jgi:hypothetical protein
MKIKFYKGDDMKFGIKDIDSIKVIDIPTGKVVHEFKGKELKIEREIEKIDYYYKDKKVKSEEITHTDTVIIE